MIDKFEMMCYDVIVNKLRVDGSGRHGASWPCPKGV